MFKKVRMMILDFQPLVNGAQSRYFKLKTHNNNKNHKGANMIKDGEE